MRVAILSSKGGELAECVLQQVSDGQVDRCEVVGVITNTNDCSITAQAHALGIRTQVFVPQFQEELFFESQLLRALQSVRAELIVQLDWRVRTPTGVMDAYPGKIINHYPAALDPTRDYDFGGDDMFDLQGMAAAIAYHQLLGESDMIMESSVHYVSSKKYHADLVSSSTFLTSRLENWSFFRGKQVVMSNRAIESAFKSAVKERLKSLHPYAVLNVISALRRIVRADSQSIVRKSALVDLGNEDTLAQAKAIAQYTFPSK